VVVRTIIFKRVPSFQISFVLLKGTVAYPHPASELPSTWYVFLDEDADKSLKREKTCGHGQPSPVASFEKFH